MQLEAWRKAKGLSLRELAQITGLAKSYLSDLERGAPSPSVSTLYFLEALTGKAVTARDYVKAWAAANTKASSQARRAATISRRSLLAHLRTKRKGSARGRKALKSQKAKDKKEISGEKEARRKTAGRATRRSTTGGGGATKGGGTNGRRGC